MGLKNKKTILIKEEYSVLNFFNYMIISMIKKNKKVILVGSDEKKNYSFIKRRIFTDSIVAKTGEMALKEAVSKTFVFVESVNIIKEAIVIAKDKSFDGIMCINAEDLDKKLILTLLNLKKGNIVLSINEKNRKWINGIEAEVLYPRFLI